MSAIDALVGSLAVVAAGAGAWMGSRDGRRLATGPATITARPGWARQLATWAAATCWLIAAYLGLAAVVYGVTAGRAAASGAEAGQAAWGGAPGWPVAVGAAVLTALCALGFAAGAFFPGRFTAPAAALGAFLFVLPAALYALLTPARVPPARAGPFPGHRPDLSIVQVMFLTGLAVTALGAVGLHAAPAGPGPRRAAALVTAAGLAAAGTAVGLAGTARQTPQGVVIPALHHAARPRPAPHAHTVATFTSRPRPHRP